MIQLHPSRLAVLQDEFEQDYFQKLKHFLLEEKKNWYTIYPASSQRFQAFNLTPFHEVKIVILGQDPYHGAGQAHGLAFSVPDGITIPPSLRNIYKELHQEWFANYQKDSPLRWTDNKLSGNLTRRAEQWVLLLNAILTVRANSAGSHRGQWRELFTDTVISKLSQERSWIVFLLRGNFAKSKKVLIDESRHLVLTASHPSPLSAHRGWLGSDQFKTANNYLLSHWQEQIDW